MGPPVVGGRISFERQNWIIMSSLIEKESLSAWVKHEFVQSDPSIGMREADVCKHTEGVVFSLFQLQEVRVNEVILCVSLSQLGVERCRRQVYSIGVIVKGCGLTRLECDGRVAVQRGLTECLEDFQYVRHESGRVISGDVAPVDALFDDDRSVTSVEQFVKSSVDGRVFSRPVVECDSFHWLRKRELGCGDRVSVRGNGSGRKRSMHDDEDEVVEWGKKRKSDLSVSFFFKVIGDDEYYRWIGRRIASWWSEWCGWSTECRRCRASTAVRKQEGLNIL